MRCARLLWALPALAALFAAAPANACSVTANAVNFGNYDPQTPAPTDGAGFIFLNCAASTTAPEIELGTGGSGTFALREMNNGTSDLGYNLYTSAARTFVWGDGSSGTMTVTASGGFVIFGRRLFFPTIYGRIPASQTQVTAGTYGDTLFVTVTF